MNPKAKNTLRWVAVVLMALVLLFAIFLVVERTRGRAALNRYLAKMRAQGEKFTIAELAPAPVPPELNGAGLLMAAGFRANGIVPQQIPGSMRFATSGVAVPAARIHAWTAGGQSNVLLTTNFPGDAPATNASATNAAPRRGWRPSGPGGLGRPVFRTILTSSDLAAEIARHSNTLAQAHAALLLGPIDHNLDYSKGFTMLLSHLSRDKTLSQWLRAASLSALQQTNLEAALTNLVALGAFSHATTNEPMMISQLVRIAVHQIGVSAMWEALQVDGWTEEQLRALQTVAEPSDFVDSMGRALEMERAMGVMMIDRASEDFSTAITLFEGDSSLFGATPSSDEMEELTRKLRVAFLNFIYLPVWKVAWKDQDKLRLMKHWQGDIDLARKQAQQANWRSHVGPATVSASGTLEPASEGEEEGVAKSFLDQLRCPFSSRLSVAGFRSLNRSVTAEVSRELAVTAIALHRFHIARGIWPASLDELVPKFLTLPPIDPFDGRPLRYRRNADGTFALYSVGPDGKDDGGDARSPFSSNRPQFFNGRDIVWPRATSAEELQKVIDQDSRSRQ